MEKIILAVEIASVPDLSSFLNNIALALKADVKASVAFDPQTKLNLAHLYLKVKLQSEQMSGGAQEATGSFELDQGRRTSGSIFALLVQYGHGMGNELVIAYCAIE